MQKADHSGHRARMRKRLIEYGLDSFEPHEVLELLLYYAIPQRNTNDIAKNLLKRFGSLSAVFDASLEALKSFGLTEHQAVFLKLFPDVTRLYLSDRYGDEGKVFDYSRTASYIVDKFIGYEHEENFLIIMLDKKGKELFCGMISEGDLDSINVSIRRIVSLALNYSASSVILAHNHPSGLAIPSAQDVSVTLDIKKALGYVGVTLLDHYIVADHDCVSMVESRLI